jgi:hypothetical protein
MQFKLLVASTLFVLAVVTGTLGAQQSTSATLSGRVVDQMGAVIVGTQITAKSKATGLQRDAKTNDQGIFVLTNLPPGEYEVKAEMPGFKARVYSATLEVGQNATADVSLDVGGVMGDDFSTPSVELINKVSSVVDGVINHREIDRLPLNGRNFLELALLVPGNSPAPNFDPTKTNTVLISSAGQLGRGGNVTIDGADNNDDVVGGSLENISQDAVQEFQIATNRFSAQLGRSGSAVINIVTKSGTNSLHGSGSFFYRDRNLQGLTATFDRNNPEPPFDREQYSATLGGPLVKDKVFLFGAFEYRNQDGVVLVGQRDTTTRSITRGFAPAPLNDLLGTVRGDWKATDAGSLTFRYSIERADDTGASTLIRPIGSESERQASNNHYQAFPTN